MVISILLNIGMVTFVKTLHNVFIVQKQIFQIKILNEMNIILSMIYVLIQFKLFI